MPRTQNVLPANVWSEPAPPEPKGLIGRVTARLLDRQLRKGFEGFLTDLETAAQQQPTA